MVMTDMAKVTKQEWQRMRSLMERGVYAFDDTADPEDTQFGYCIYCFEPDYTDHAPGCRWLEIQQTINKLEKQLGFTK